MSITSDTTTTGTTDATAENGTGQSALANHYTLPGVPWLADIPVLGILFRKDAEKEQKNELIVFITPTVIKRAEG